MTDVTSPERREYLAAVALDDARCFLTRGYAANDPELREVVRTVIRAYEQDEANHAADLTREEAAVEILDTLKRWLHPDLDDWPTWRIDDMIGEIIDAARIAHHPTATGDAGELSGYDEFDRLAACPQCKGRGVVTDNHRATAEQDGDGR